MLERGLCWTKNFFSMSTLPVTDVTNQGDRGNTGSNCSLKWAKLFLFLSQFFYK